MKLSRFTESVQDVKVWGKDKIEESVASRFSINLARLGGHISGCMIIVYPILNSRVSTSGTKYKNA